MNLLAMDVEDRNECIDQMNGDENVKHEKKSQHVDTEVGGGVGNSLMACHIINKEWKLIEK